MSIDIDLQNPSDVLNEDVNTRATDDVAESPSMQTPPVPQTADQLETAQDDDNPPKAIQTPSATDEMKALAHTVVLVKPEPAANTTDVSPDPANVSEPDVLKLKTPALTIAASDVSSDDTMSTRSCSSSLPTEMTGSAATYDKAEDPGEAEVSETSNKILDIVLEYSLNKFDSTVELHIAGRPKFLAVVSRFVRARQKVVMCLPAFPFKSANKVEKVLGTLPDKAEELALARLNSMCATIGHFYEPGAELTVISDGLVYNGSFLLCIPHLTQSENSHGTSLTHLDLLGISDQDTWRYGSALRAMAERKAFSYLAFSRLQDLVAVKNFRGALFNKHGRDGDLDIDHEIATNPDTLRTYKGYCRFLQSDLQHIYGPAKSTAKYRKDVKYLAKQMLIRGYVSLKFTTSPSHFEAHPTFYG
jgi:pyoverdine/dityrosine biosynthesis protein Dit1